MKRSALAVLGLVLVLGACSSDSPTASSSSSSPASTSSSSSPSSPGASSSSSSPSVAAGPTLAIKELKAAQNAKVGQQILVTDTGVALYLYAPDGTSTTSTVDAGLKAVWPAVVATDPASLVLTGIDPTKLGVQAQPDG